MQVLLIFLLSTFLAIFGASSAYFLFSIESAHAAPLSLSASPSLVEFITNPTEEVKAPLQVTNEGDEPLTLEIKLIPFLPKNGDGQEFLNIELPIKDIITIEDKEIPVNELVLRPKEVRLLTLHVFLPKEIEAADYYFSIAFLSKTSAPSPIPPQTQGVQAYLLLRGGVAINVLLSVRESGEEVHLVRIVEFSSPKFLQRGPVAFKVRVKNEGKHFLKPAGRVLITNLFGQQVASLPLSTKNILTESTRAYPEIVFPQVFFLGPYQAQLELNLPDEKITAKTGFFAFPLRELFFGIFIGLVVLIIQKRVRERLSR